MFLGQALFVTQKIYKKTLLALHFIRPKRRMTSTRGDHYRIHKCKDGTNRLRTAHMHL